MSDQALKLMLLLLLMLYTLLPDGETQEEKTLTYATLLVCKHVIPLLL